MIAKIKVQAIREFSKEASRLIADLKESDPDHESFEQCGILDGERIVIEFLDVGEWGLALRHLLYMIYESDIDFECEKLKTLESIATEFGINSPYLS